MKKIAAIILAAGKGKRMKALKQNKVVFKLADKHMIAHTVDLLDKLKIETKIAVIGFAKESVMDVLKNRVIYAVQKKRLGTAHAVLTAFKKLPKNVSDVLILQGDDSALYKKETIAKLIGLHFLSKAAFTFLTIDVDNPTGLGRVLRDKNDKLRAVVEEKDATEIEKQIKEINPACYVISVDFLKKYLKKIEKSKITGEYYLTSLIDIAIKNNEKIIACKAGKIAWRGVNTPEELKEAEMLFLQTK